MKIAIIGSGKMGRYLANILLKEKHNITIIDNNINVINNISNTLDVNTIQGDALNIDTLIDADIKINDIVICCMNKDEDNIICSLLVKKLGVKNIIARVRNPIYLKSINFIKDDLGISILINPELLTANEIEKELRFSKDTKANYLAKGKMLLIEIKISDNSVLKGLKISDVKNKIKTKVLIVGVNNNDKYFVPNAEYMLNTGDKILVTALKKDIYKFNKEIGNISSKIKDVMIIGGSKISYYLANELCESGIRVKIIEADKNKCINLEEKLNKALIINGDGSDTNLLIEEGINNVDAFIAATGIDEENVVFSMFANSLNVGRVLTKINHLNFSNVLESVGIMNIITPHVVASNTILKYVRAIDNSKTGDMETLIRLNDDLEIMEFKIKNDFKYASKQIKNINFKEGILIISIYRKGKIIFPTADDTILINDTIIVATNKKGIKGLNNILG